MNQYAAMAERHWRRWLPSRVAAMDDPSSFFSNLGEEAAAQIEDLTADRVRANVEAISTLHAIEREERDATPDEQAVLARWSGWGAVPETFDPSREDLAWARRDLGAMLSEQELAAAARNTLNAHYTDAELVKVIWDADGQLGFTEGRVLELGCGSGNFIGFAPEGAQMLGVELEPVTAAIARALYPDAHVLTQSFADLRLREGTFDLVVGNVPFGKVALTTIPDATGPANSADSGAEYGAPHR